MDLATGLGILGGIVTICAIIIIDGGNFAAFYDKHAVIIIFGGATASTMTRFPFSVITHGIPMGMRFAFTMSAAFAGFAGWLFALVNGFVSPESFQMTMSFNFLAGAIVGGITSISGALIGALFITFIPDWASEINLAMSGIIYGGCLVVMMLVARDGVVGLARQGYARLRPYLFERNRGGSQPREVVLQKTVSTTISTHGRKSS
jgi:hypothetical protein